MLEIQLYFQMLTAYKYYISVPLVSAKKSLVGIATKSVMNYKATHPTRLNAIYIVCS